MTVVWGGQQRGVDNSVGWVSWSDRRDTQRAWLRSHIGTLLLLVVLLVSPVRYAAKFTG